MIINNFYILRKIFLSLALLVLLLPYPNIQVLAQVVCDPLPTDTEDLLECNLQDLENFPQTTYEAGTNPSQPSTFSFSGIGGLAAAYSESKDLLLLIGTNINQNDTRPILGMMADPRTLQPRTMAVQINSGQVAGSPEVVYSSELDKFLVTWEDSRPCGQNCRSVYGRYVSAEGIPQGNDFAINSGSAYLVGVAYDEVNNRFVVSYENDGLFFRTVDENGNVSAAVKITSSYPYQGQMGLTVNTNSNEYWVAYTVVASNLDTATEDDRIMFSRVDAKTLKAIGQPVQLSQARVGPASVQAAHIAYSPSGGGAMAIWRENGREGISGTWGRTIYDDGTLSAEYPVITVGINPYSEGFSSDQVLYNKWTDSFFVPSGDWNGNAWITEIDLSGLIYSQEPALSVPLAISNFWDKIANLFINKAVAAAIGNFNVTAAVTPYGAVTLSSQNYATAAGTSYTSVNAPGPASPVSNPVPRTPSEVDITTLPKLINQIYVWGLGISVLLALLMMVLGGYYIMTAAGNAEQSSKGKEYITASLIGVVIIFSAYLLLNEINPDLVNLNLDSLKNFGR